MRTFLRWMRALVKNFTGDSNQTEIDNQIASIATNTVSQVKRLVTNLPKQSGTVVFVYFISPKSSTKNNQIWVVVKIISNVVDVTICDAICSEPMDRFNSLFGAMATRFRSHGYRVTIAHCDTVPQRGSTPVTKYSRTILGPGSQCNN